MKTRNLIVIFGVCAVVALVGITAWGGSGNMGGKPDEDPGTLPETPIDGYYFWRLGHMDGPHDMSKAMGISRDGKVAVGATQVVDFVKAFRIDIDWAISTDDGIAPLYNELQVQENIGKGLAYAASDMDGIDNDGVPVDCDYDKVDPLNSSSVDNFVWCGSQPVGTLTVGTVSYGAEWLWALDPEYDPTVDDPNYLGVPDFGGGTSGMAVNDVSADGLILVGTGHTMSGPQAFRVDTTVVDPDTEEPIVVQLTITDNMTDPDVTGQTLQTSSAQAVSADDGTIIAGFGATATGNKAFVTTFLGVDETTGEAILESYVLPALDGGKWSEAYAMTVTDEGVIYIAGRSDSPKGPQACIWFWGEDPSTSGEYVWLVKGIGGLSKKKYDSVANSIVYRPGSTAGDLMVVGTSKTILYPAEAFVWTGNPVLEPDGTYTLPDGTVADYIGYMYDLEKILIKTGAAEASAAGSAWVLFEGAGVALSDVTNDGDNGPSARIVGSGLNPEGGIEAWLVTNYPYDDLVFVKE